MNKINRIIEETPFISDLQKEFFMTMLSRQKILAYSLELLYNRNDSI